MLRNPVERAYSAYLSRVRDGRERLGFSKALKEEEACIRDNWNPSWHYKRRGFYYEQLVRYYELFGRERIRLHAVCLALGLKDRVTFLGEVGREQIRELLTGCEFLTLSSWSEGIPTVALEAMASGKAVVGTRVGGLPEIVSDAETGLLVPPGDPDSLAEAMLLLLRNREQGKAMGERGQAFVKAHHDFAQTVDRYLDVYRQALRDTNAGRDRKKRPDPGSKLGVE